MKWILAIVLCVVLGCDSPKGHRVVNRMTGTRGYCIEAGTRGRLLEGTENYAKVRLDDGTYEIWLEGDFYLENHDAK